MVLNDYTVTEEMKPLRQVTPGRILHLTLPNGCAGQASRKSLIPQDLSHCETAAFQREDQVFGVQLELFQAHFFKLFVFGKVRLLKQLFQALSVAVMFCVQAISLSAQQETLY